MAGIQTQSLTVAGPAFYQCAIPLSLHPATFLELRIGLVYVNNTQKTGL